MSGAEASNELPPSTSDIIVVWLESLADSVEALRGFFAYVSENSGRGYVVILPMSPEHDSHLAMLRSVTPVPVIQVTERVIVEPNHVYVITPDQHLLLIDGALVVSPNMLAEECHASVNGFFRTLVETQGPRAVCITLSEAGAHGAIGFKRIFLGTSESINTAGDLYALVSREHHSLESQPTGTNSYLAPEWMPTLAQEARAPDSETRQTLLLALSDVLRTLSNPTQIQGEAARLLGEHLGVSRAYYAETVADGHEIVIHQDYTNGVPSVVGRYTLSDFLFTHHDQLLDGQIISIADTAVAPDLNEHWRVMLHMFHMRAIIAVPLIKDGRRVGNFCVAQSEPRQWTTHEIALVAEVAERMWTAITHANAEATMHASGQHLQVIIKHLPGAAAFIVDRNLRYVLAEGEALASAGLKPEDLTGKTIFEALPAELAARYEPVYRRAFAGEPFEEEHNAHGHTYISRGIPLRSTNGDIYAVLVISYDISERKHAEQALRESEERFRTLTDAVPQMTWANRVDGTAHYFNARWYDYSGLSYEQSVGTGWQVILHPDDAPGVIERWQQAVTAGEVFDIVYRLRRADGVYRWHIGRAVPVRDEQGQLTGWFGAATDIEALKRAEVAVRESEERFRLLVEGAHDYAMLLLDTSNSIIFWSSGAERVFGWSETEAIGQGGEIIFTPEDLESGAMEREVYTALTQGRAEDRRWHLRNDGSRLFVDGVLIRLNQEDGQLRGFVKIGRDVTALRQAEENLQHSRDELERRVEERTAALATANQSLQQEISERRQIEAERTTLLQRVISAQEDERRRIAHDVHDQMGQSVTVLMLAIKAVRDRVESDAELQPLLNNLYTLGTQLGQDVRTLALELRPPALDDVGILPTLTTYLAQWSNQTGIVAEVQSTGQDGMRLPPVIETTIFRVVQEALTNITRHAQATTVSVIVHWHASTLQVIVEDDGTGFDTTAWRRQPPAERRLGLLGMRERVEQIGGTLRIEASRGNGTTLFVTIPLSPTM